MLFITALSERSRRLFGSQYIKEKIQYANLYLCFSSCSQICQQAWPPRKLDSTGFIQFLVFVLPTRFLRTLRLFNNFKENAVVCWHISLSAIKKGYLQCYNDLRTSHKTGDTWQIPSNIINPFKNFSLVSTGSNYLNATISTLNSAAIFCIKTRVSCCLRLSGKVIRYKEE